MIINQKGRQGGQSGVRDNGQYRELMSKRIQQINLKPANKEFAPLIQSSVVSFERYHKKAMDPMRKAILVNSIENLVTQLVRSGRHSREMIKSAAVENIWDVDNPINMLFNLLSVVVPNFAFMEVAGVQPMPTQKSPLLYPQLTANTQRNGFNVGDQLLGYSGWNPSSLYTSNRNIVNAALTVGDTTVTVPASPAGTVLMPNWVQITWIPASGIGGEVLTDDGAGNINGTAVTGTVNYSNATFNLELAANAAAGDVLEISYRYNLDAFDPAQVIFEWVSKEIESMPYRIRSIYNLDNFYGAKKTLAGVEFDLDKALATTMAGYVNKEISCNVFNNIMDQASDVFQWDSTVPTGVSWAFHRLSVLEPLIACRNKIRQDTARASGNILIASNDLMNNIESLGKDMWAPVGYDAEPIGPYVAGELNGVFKVIKNQDYPDTRSIMTFKKDDTDAAYMVGVFLGLYATEPLGLDTLKVVQGMGSQIGEILAFELGVKEIEVIAS